MTKVLGRSILAISAALVTAVGLIALAVAAGAAAPARRALGFGFGGLRPGPQTALAIFAHNAMLLGGVILAAAVVHLAGRRKLASAQRLGADVLARSALDALVALEAAFNVAILGAAIGAYGTRMLRAILPHGPLELLAFAGGLALYRHAREGRLGWPLLLWAGAALLALLAGAALLETYVAL
jgi:hypothetical protein